MSNSSPALGRLTPLLPAGDDMQAALDFYEHTLGFTVTFKQADLSLAILRRSDAEIMLVNTDDPHTASQTSLRIQTADVDALYNEYQAQAIPAFELGGGAGLGTLRATPWGTREFAVRDLAGVCITFYQDQR